MKTTTFKILRLQSSKKVSEVAPNLGIAEVTYRKYEHSGLLPSATVLSLMPSIYGCTDEDVMQAYKCHKHIYTTKKNLKKKAI